MQNYKLILFSVAAIVFLTHCQNSGGGDATPIPSVSVSCTSSSCAAANGTKNLFVYITTSGCLSTSYGQVATGTGTVSCSSGICSAATITWSDTSGAAISQLPSNSYDFCSIIDIKGSYAGTVPAGDSTSSKSTVFIGSSTNPVSSISIANWINGPFLN